MLAILAALPVALAIGSSPSSLLAHCAVRGWPAAVGGLAGFSAALLVLRTKKWVFGGAVSALLCASLAMVGTQWFRENAVHDPFVASTAALPEHLASVQLVSQTDVEGTYDVLISPSGAMVALSVTSGFGLETDHFLLFGVEGDGVEVSGQALAFAGDDEVVTFDARDGSVRAIRLVGEGDTQVLWERTAALLAKPEIRIDARERRHRIQQAHRTPIRQVKLKSATRPTSGEILRSPTTFRSRARLLGG